MTRRYRAVGWSSQWQLHLDNWCGRHQHICSLEHCSALSDQYSCSCEHWTKCDVIYLL